MNIVRLIFTQKMVLNIPTSRMHKIESTCVPTSKNRFYRHMMKLNDLVSFIRFSLNDSPNIKTLKIDIK